MDNLMNWAPGEMIGQIEIISRIGEGGMGVVFSAFDHRLKRRVALKILQTSGQMEKRFRRRFLREAQILSHLNHPRVCQIHDLLMVGDTEVLVLEEVQGFNLREAMTTGLDRRRALEIGVQLFEVLADVHREGIVHRDLKAENIMLQPDGGVKVLDFGIARAHEMIGRDSPDSIREDGLCEGGCQPVEQKIPTEALTSAGALIGTPRIMSPEQARGEPAGPAADIYAIGLLLQEMLTGESPFEKDLPRDILLRKVILGDIRPPSGLKGDLRSFLQRLTSLASADRPSARDAGDQLRALLDAPRRRRRRFLVVVILMLLALLASGFGIQWRRALHEAERAQRSLTETREVSSFLEQLFQLSNPFLPDGPDGQAKGSTVTAGELLARAVETIRDRFKEQPLARARFLLLLGGIEKNLGHLKTAESLLEEALEIRRKNLPTGHRDLGLAMKILGQVRCRLAKYDEAEKLLTQALEIARGGSPSDEVDVADALESLGVLESERGHPKKVTPLLQQALEIRMRQEDPDGPAQALTLQRLGSNLNLLMRYGEAREYFEKSLTIVQNSLGAEHPAMIPLLNEIARLEQVSGDTKSAKAHFREGLRISRKKLPATHPLIATVMTNLANILDEEKHYEEAESLYYEALAIKEESVGMEHPETAQVILNLALLKQNLGQFEESKELFARALRILETTMGPEHPSMGLALNNIAVLEQEWQHFEKAEELYVRALKIFRARLSPEHALCGLVLSNLGEVNRLQGKLDASESYYRQALSVGENAFAPDSHEMAEIFKGLAATQALRGEPEEAENLRQKADAILRIEESKDGESQRNEAGSK